MLLFVVDNKTRGITSMLEATENISRGRKVILVIVPYEEITVDQVPIEGSEKKDLSRARKYLLDIAKRHETPVFSGVEEAVKSIE